MSMSKSEAGRLGAKKTNLIWKDRYNRNPSHCKNCNQQLPYEKRKNKFCDQSCSASFNNKKREKKKRPLCLCCGAEVGANSKKYCSNACQGEFEWKKKKSQILSEAKAPNHWAGKKFLLETRGTKCEICNITEWRGQLVPLVMDHIDGNSDNNLLSNLRLVCGNCDMQLPTYKNKNRGNGRHKRRQRYETGQSF